MFRSRRLPADGLTRCHGRLGLQPAFGDLCLHCLLELLEGADLDLAYPLARDAVLLRQLLERGRIVLQPALDQDVPLALVQRLERTGQQRLAAGQFLAIGVGGLLAVGLIDQPVLPFALAVLADRARSGCDQARRGGGSC